MNQVPQVEPAIFPMFATPFASLIYPQSDRLNQELELFFDSLVKQGNRFKNPQPHNYVQDNLFESNFDLFNYDNLAVQKLRQFVLQSIGRVIARVNNYKGDQISKVRLYTDSWFHITEFAGYFYTHNHPMASWSAVYCVNPGEQPLDKPDSGVLRFHDPRPHCNSYMDAGNAALCEPYVTTNFNFKLTAGHLVIFPSYLQHEVAPFMGKDRRITVAVNCWTDRYGG